MIPIFRRKELTITFSMEEQAKIREALAAAEIDYSLRTIDRTSPGVVSAGRARDGSFGKASETTREYIFYVRRENYAAALAAIGQGAYLG